jgi:hypothetical protein
LFLLHPQQNMLSMKDFAPILFHLSNNELPPSL